MSGHPDSNWGSPAPKAGAITGLRYAPNRAIKKRRLRGVFGGEGGIRTPGTLIEYDSLANCWFQPLTHLSVCFDWTKKHRFFSLEKRCKSTNIFQTDKIYFLFLFFPTYTDSIYILIYIQLYSCRPPHASCLNLPSQPTINAPDTPFLRRIHPPTDPCPNHPLHPFPCQLPPSVQRRTDHRGKACARPNRPSTPSTHPSTVLPPPSVNTPCHAPKK